MNYTIEYEQEEDGRWLAEVIELPGVLAYGQTSEDAVTKAQALALRVLADQLEHGEGAREMVNITFAAA
ncbi:MAG: type II toxin-antitoxin system HicB family antitoxin [Acidobacteriota bacterium]|nr:type II toxin-antitoxin system HicB family antitoxin [Acidobacteriota bacterium]